FLHLSLSVRLAEAGMTVLLTSGAQEGVPILPGKAGFDYAEGTLFSVLGFSDLAGLTVSGAKWPLDGVEVAFGSSLTISNEIKGRLEIALERGRALLLAHPYPLPES
ncbi:MAG: thiamine diphosphokinase, partial [Mesorhizobium sp.]